VIVVPSDMLLSLCALALTLAPQCHLHTVVAPKFHVAASACGRHAAVSACSPDDGGWQQWADANGVIAPKLTVRAPRPEERGKGGVFASEPIAPMEVLARIPRALVLRPVAVDADDASWAAELTAAALLILHADDASADEDTLSMKTWLQGWIAGGWATDNADLGAPGVRWGSDDVTGSLLATGSDNDHNIYAKFRFPCHPVVHRSGLGLAQLTGASKGAALAALQCRGRSFRAMRDALIPLVHTPTPRSQGSTRDRKAWDVADALSRVLSRATTLFLEDDAGAAQAPTCAVVPLHERLEHCDARGENAKLVGSDPRDQSARDDVVLLVATRGIQSGEAITRNYADAPRLPDDASDGALRLLLQFGLPPSAWPASQGDRERQEQEESQRGD